MRYILIILLALVSFGGASRTFDGVDDKIVIARNASFETIPSTMCIWARFISPADFPPIFSITDTDSNPSLNMLYDHTADKVNFECKDAAAAKPFQIVSTSTTLDDDNWHHLCGVSNTDANVARLYVDGVEDATDTVSGTCVFVGDDALYIGDALDTFWGEVDGELAWAEWHSVELTAVEIAETYLKPCSIVANIELCLPLLETGTAIDISGNGRDGTATDTTASPEGPPIMVGGGSH